MAHTTHFYCYQCLIHITMFTIFIVNKSEKRNAMITSHQTLLMPRLYMKPLLCSCLNFDLCQHEAASNQANDRPTLVLLLPIVNSTISTNKPVRAECVDPSPLPSSIMCPSNIRYPLITPSRTSNSVQCLANTHPPPTMILIFYHCKQHS